VKRPNISIDDTGSNCEDYGTADEALRRFDHICGMERLEFVGKRLPEAASWALTDQ
jgi:hypothetical protein